MMELVTNNEPVDILTLSNRLKEAKLLDQIGGTSFLTDLSQTVPSASNITYYAEIIRKNYLLRLLIEHSDNLSQLCYDGSCELEEVLDEAEKSVFSITNQGSKLSYSDMKSSLFQTWERIDEMSENKGIGQGVASGFDSLDKLLAGFHRSDLVILAARPSVGKTAFALDIVRHAAIQQKVPVGFFSLEMSSEQLVYRMLAAQSQVDAWKLRTQPHTLNQTNEFDALRKASDELSSAPIYIDDQPGNNILKMRSVARRLKSEKGLGLIVVDYLQLMVPTQTRASDNVVQQVTELSRSLKNLARELDVPVIALSQLSRAVESRGGKPRLSDLRDSGSIEQDADVVMFIHREKNEQDGGRDGLTEILVEKHRNGPTGRVELMFNNQKGSFQTISKNDYGGAESSFNDDF
jgi:replicative DNA helicase